MFLFCFTFVKCTFPLRVLDAMMKKFIMSDPIILDTNSSYYYNCYFSYLLNLNRYVLAGIVSWGLECGKKDVPGVYADVTQGLCFIDYATKCMHGKEYQRFYDYPQCANWLEDLIAK